MGRLLDEYKRCRQLYDETHDDQYIQKTYSLEHYFECETGQTYEFIKDFAKENGFHRVYDIGCAYGYQSEIFLNEGVDYIGINNDLLDYWNKDVFRYITKTYPFRLANITKEELAISVMCLTWNCYLYEKDTLHDQCLALSRDFDNVLLYMSNDKINEVSKYFKGNQKLGNNFVYFYN